MSMARLRAALDGLSPRDRRALGLGALLVGPALLWVLAVRPYFGALGDMRDRLASEQALLQREKALLIEAPGYGDMMKSASVAVHAWEDRLLDSSNRALAEAELTTLLERAARRNRVLLQEAATAGLPRGEPIPEGLAPVRMSVSGESDFEGVLGFLGALEREDVLLRIVGLSMDRQTVARSVDVPASPARAAAMPQPGTLTFTIIVEGYTRSESQETG